MTKTITFSGTADGVTASDRDDVLAAADGWHDPDAGREVNHINYTYPETGGSPRLSVAVRIQDVPSDDRQPAINNLAQAIAGLPADFGTVAEVRDAIDSQ